MDKFRKQPSLTPIFAILTPIFAILITIGNVKLENAIMNSLIKMALMGTLLSSILGTWPALGDSYLLTATTYTCPSSVTISAAKPTLNNNWAYSWSDGSSGW